MAGEVKVFFFGSPKFKKYTLSGQALADKLMGIGIPVPLGMLDEPYTFTDHSGWQEVCSRLFYKGIPKINFNDCDKIADQTRLDCSRKYGLNAFGMGIGLVNNAWIVNLPHAYNIMWTGDRFMLMEPQLQLMRLPFPFEIGEHGYAKPDKVLI